MDWITHEEDVWFDFQGDSPDQLTPGRFYRGTIDGVVEFGVFVDLAPGVTGLLHRNELPRRLESYDWSVGDTLFVQVKNIRDNGNIDLGWSIRQSGSEFRGARVDDPEGAAEGEPISESGTDESGTESDSVEVTPTPAADVAGGPAADGVESESEAETSAESETQTETETGEEPEPEPADGELERVPIADLSDRVGDVVRLEGEVVGARQTSGPTVFELRDETGVVDCAAFVEAGVRAYPEVEVGDVARLDGEVELRREELQVETEAMEVLAGDDAAAVERRLADALVDEARPETVEPLADHAPVAAVTEQLREAATAIRRAVLESRPVVVRHAASADGYVAGAAIERAVLPLVRENHADADAEYHYFTRRPLDDIAYGMDAATNDVTRMLSARDQHDEKLPLVVLVGTGSTVNSTDGLNLLGIYGARRVVVDAAPADEEIAEACEVLVDPARADADAADLSPGALSASLGAAINADVREDLAHLPAVSYWEGAPEAYETLAREAGYDADRVREIREAIALEAYYQSYEDKRELITDLLFGDDSEDAEVRSLASHVSEQFREKLETEIETAQANVERRQVDGVAVQVLDTDAYTHRFDFPPTRLLLDELHRRNRDDDPFVTVGLATDELFVDSTAEVDVRAVAETVRERVPEAGVTAVGAREGRIEFLAGERDDVLEAVLDAVVEQVA